MFFKQKENTPRAALKNHQNTNLATPSRFFLYGFCLKELSNYISIQQRQAKRCQGALAPQTINNITQYNSFHTNKNFTKTQSQQFTTVLRVLKIFG
jgi:hypothetical protein